MSVLTVLALFACALVHAFVLYLWATRFTYGERWTYIMGIMFGQFAVMVLWLLVGATCE